MEPSYAETFACALESSQGVLLDYITPDSGISSEQCINNLLSILDDQELVRCLREYRMNVPN